MEDQRDNKSFNQEYLSKHPEFAPRIKMRRRTEHSRQRFMKYRAVEYRLMRNIKRRRNDSIGA